MSNPGKFFYGMCGHEWELAVHGGRCPECHHDTRLEVLIRAEPPGEHPYHGPLGAPDEHGQRRAVPDPAHERFHGAIGDIIAGKILPKAREQMARELAKAPPHQETTASTPAPMPGKALGSFGDRRRIGAA